MSNRIAEFRKLATPTPTTPPSPSERNALLVLAAAALANMTLWVVVLAT